MHHLVDDYAALQLVQYFADAGQQAQHNLHVRPVCLDKYILNINFTENLLFTP